MKVGLWAEIRRLAEIEKLSGWAISRRLHCSRHTVAAALRLDQPPACEVARRASILDPHRSKIDELLARYPELSAVRIREEIARGPDGYTGSASVKNRSIIGRINLLRTQPSSTVSGSPFARHKLYDTWAFVM